ncbi:MAG: sulfatase [Acidobacteriota bacterium]
MRPLNGATELSYTLPAMMVRAREALRPVGPLGLVLLTVVFVLAFAACRNVESDAEASDVVASPPPNLLLITIDTLRADRLSAYGHERQTSPTLDRLAAEGVRFERAAVQWPKTGPSFASMFTSTYPSQNGIVRHVGIELPCAFRMLAEELRAAGYSTHAVVSNGAVASELHYDQGFDTYVETWKVEPTPSGPDPSTAGGVTDLAIRAVEDFADGAPYFLWVHYLDPHFPYTAPGDYLDLYVDDEYFEPVREIQVADNPDQQMVQLGYSRVLSGRTDLGFYLARYDSEIAYTDAEVDRLLEALGGRGLLDDTLTAVTSDHGESLGEHHYYFDHGRFGFQTCLHVPLIVHAPERLEPRVVDRPVELVDLAPTLLEAAGVALPDGRWAQGRSLWPLLRGEARDADEHQLAFSEAGVAHNRRWQHVVQSSEHKLIYTRAKQEQQFIGGIGDQLVLYDLRSDPGETRNVAGEQPVVFEDLRRRLWTQVNAEPFEVLREEETCGGDSEGLSSETEAQLRALGYL